MTCIYPDTTERHSESGLEESSFMYNKKSTEPLLASKTAHVITESKTTRNKRGPEPIESRLGSSREGRKEKVDEWRQRVNPEEKRRERDQSRNETAYCRISTLEEILAGTDSTTGVEEKEGRWAKGS